MIRLLRGANTGSELLFKKIPMAFDYRDGFTSDVAEDVIATKNLFDGLLGELKSKLITDVKTLFVAPNMTDVVNRMSLASIIRDWCDSLDPAAYEQLFADGTDRFLTLAKDVTNDDDLFISRLAKCVTNLRTEDWDDKTQELFMQSLEQYKHLVFVHLHLKIDESPLSVKYSPLSHSSIQFPESKYFFPPVGQVKQLLLSSLPSFSHVLQLS